jgi:hypothetical protein
VRARLGEIKVAPVNAETLAEEAPGFDTLPSAPVPKSAAGKRAEAD